MTIVYKRQYAFLIAEWEAPPCECSCPAPPTLCRRPRYRDLRLPDLVSLDVDDETTSRGCRSLGVCETRSLPVSLYPSLPWSTPVLFRPQRN